MRTRRLATGIVVGALVVAGAGATAIAQQHPHDAHHLAPLPRAKFPMRAAHYQLILTRLVAVARRVVGHGGVTQGDVDKVVLQVHECAAAVEADGWVTANEAARCNQLFEQLDPSLHEPKTPKR